MDVVPEIDEGLQGYVIENEQQRTQKVLSLVLGKGIALLGVNLAASQTEKNSNLFTDLAREVYGLNYRLNKAVGDSGTLKDVDVPVGGYSGGNMPEILRLMLSSLGNISNNSLKVKPHGNISVIATYFPGLYLVHHRSLNGGSIQDPHHFYTLAGVSKLPKEFSIQSPLPTPY